MRVPVRSDCQLSSRAMVATWPDFPKKQATIFFCALRDRWKFGDGDSSGSSQTADCILVSGSYREIQVSSPVSTFLVNFEQPPLNLHNMNSHHSTLTCCLSVNEWGIHLANRFFVVVVVVVVVVDTEMIVQYGHGRCRSDAKIFLYFSSDFFPRLPRCLLP